MSPALPHWYYVYLLLTKKNGKLYIGCTSNLKKRMCEHKMGKVFSTERYLPVELMYCETYRSRIDAFNREKALKKYGSGSAKLKLRLKDTLKEGRAG
ncbi:MAG: GIY-YIG nuclease family protein [Candidatus Omnitrophica bacterium]|nr:GIY-YIG nuclease family protein [Candidatus Omnitrophota bacterium]